MFQMQSKEDVKEEESKYESMSSQEEELCGRARILSSGSYFGKPSTGNVVKEAVTRSHSAIDYGVTTTVDRPQVKNVDHMFQTLGLEDVKEKNRYCENMSSQEEQLRSGQAF